jgi:hypothetical protein
MPRAFRNKSDDTVDLSCCDYQTDDNDGLGINPHLRANSIPIRAYNLVFSEFHFLLMKIY